MFAGDTGREKGERVDEPGGSEHVRRTGQDRMAAHGERESRACLLLRSALGGALPVALGRHPAQAGRHEPLRRLARWQREAAAGRRRPRGGALLQAA